MTKEILHPEVKLKTKVIKDRIPNDRLMRFFMLGSVINIGVIVGVLTKEIIEKRL